MKKLSKILLGTATVLSAGLMGEYYLSKYFDKKEVMEFEEAYYEALMNADANNDGKISLKELIKFEEDLFGNTGIRINDGRIVYKNGKEVPKKEVTELFRKYNQKK